MTDWIIETDRRILEIHKTYDRVGSPLLTQARLTKTLRLIDSLTSLGESIIQSDVSPR